MRSHLTAGMLARVAISCLLEACIVTPRARAYQPADIKLPAVAVGTPQQAIGDLSHVA